MNATFPSLVHVLQWKVAGLNKS